MVKEDSRRRQRQSLQARFRGFDQYRPVYSDETDKSVTALACVKGEEFPERRERVEERNREKVGRREKRESSENGESLL